MWSFLVTLILVSDKQNSFIRPFLPKEKEKKIKWNKKVCPLFLLKIVGSVLELSSIMILLSKEYHFLLSSACQMCPFDPLFLDLSWMYICLIHFWDSWKNRVRFISATSIREIRRLAEGSQSLVIGVFFWLIDFLPEISILSDGYKLDAPFFNCNFHKSI